MGHETDSNYVKSLAKGLNILSHVVNSSEPIGITHIAKELDLSIGAVQRLTYTLVNLGYLRKDEKARGYAIGHSAWAIGLSIVRDIGLKRVARPYLERLSRQIGETVNLAVLDGPEIIYVDRTKTGRILDINFHVGLRLPAHSTSMGKTMLAFLPEEELLSILDHSKLERFTPNTITDKNRLLEELQKVNKKGFSICDEETIAGLRSTAAPIRDSSGKVIAAANIAVLASSVPLEELSKEHSRKIIEMTNVISEALGHRK